MVEYLEEWSFGLGWIKELSEGIITKLALRTEDCEGEGVYKLKRIDQFHYYFRATFKMHTTV